MVGTMLGRVAAVVFVGLLAIGEVRAHDAMFVEQGGTRMLKLGAPATDIIVADPTVVDVSVQSQSQLVLIGKKYGTTQVMILSGDQVLLDSRVVVTTANQNSTVSVFSGGAPERSYACYKRCAGAEAVSSGAGSNSQTISLTLGEGGAAAAAPASAAPAQSGEATGQ